MLELTSETEEATEAERVAIFSIDGVTYDMPGEVKPHLALKYLWLLKEKNSDYATAWLMETMLGKEGFKALAEYEPLTTAQFNTIASIVQDLVMGAMEESGKAPKDRYSGNGRKKSRGPRTTSKT